MSNFMKIRNGINLGYLTADPSTGMNAGDMYYNASTNLLRLYDGTSWTTVQNTAIDTSGFLKADGSVPLAGTFSVDAEDTYEIGGNALPGVDNARIHRIWTNRVAGLTKIQGTFNDTQTDDLYIATNATNLANGSSGTMNIVTGGSDGSDDSGDELGSGNTGNLNLYVGNTGTGTRGQFNATAGVVNVVTQSNHADNAPSGQVNIGSGSSDATFGSGMNDGTGTTGDVFIFTGQTAGTRGAVHLQGGSVILDGPISALNAINMNGNTITNAVNPVNPGDVSNRAYVDQQDALAIPLSQKAAANGVATLGADSKIPSSQIPALAINETYVVANQAARLALAADVGDIAVETDNSTTYILQSLPATTNANWVALLTPPSAVTSVNSQTGNVVLTTDNVAQGSTNLYFTAGAAQTAAVVDSTAGTQTVQAASVASMKSYVAAQIATVTVADATTSTKGIVQLAGDLAGIATAPTVATVGTSTAANIHTAEVLANAATAGNINNTIVKRDGSGAISVGTISTSQINNGGAQVFISTGSGALIVDGSAGIRISTDGNNFLNQNYYDGLTLAANTSTPTEISSALSFASASFSAAKVDYVVKEATSGKTIMGTLMIANNGTTPSCTDMRSETASIGTLAFDATIVSTNVVIRFTGTDTTNASTMHCFVTKFRA